MATTANTSAVAADITAAMEERRLRWGAIFAGLTLVFALTWLLVLLGSAIGISIADASDLDAVGKGLGIGSIIWLLLTSLIATFAGALLAAKVAGSTDDRTGALHGLTVWAVSVLATLVLGAAGVGGVMSGVGSMLSSGAEAGKTIIMGQDGEDSAGGTLPESVTTAIAATLKRQASKAVSEVATGSNSPDSAEVREAMNELSAEDMGAVTSALVSGDVEVARERLSSRTSLSDAEIDSIVNGAKKEIGELKDSEAVTKAEEWVEQSVNSAKREASKAVADLGGSQVTPEEVRQAVDDLDADTLTSAGSYLIQGKPERAKDVLVAQTSMSESEINALVDGAQKEVDAVVDEARAELNKTTEAIGTYTQAVLWAAFIASCLGLIAGMIGGYMGAGTVRRLYPVRVTDHSANQPL